MFNIFIPANKLALKVIELLADSRILPAQWKYDIPMHLVQQNKQIIANAKNLADGIQYNLDKYGIEVPEEYVVAYREDKVTEMVNGKVDTKSWI